MPLLTPIGENHWNLRGMFKPVFFLNFGTQMSFIKLSTGKFIILSTVNIPPAAKAEIDTLTNNGELIEAVIATHPFHTLYFEAFHKLYPQAKFYGTPRHIQRIKIPWEGDVSTPEILSKWESEGIFMRITPGTEFINPPDSNHFASLFVYHAGSRTLYDDDTIMCYDKPGCLLRSFGTKAGSVGFHPVPYSDSLYPTKEAPIQFKEFIQKVLDDWDFDNLVTAHIGIQVGGAKQKLIDEFKRQIPILDELAKKRSA